MPYPRLASACSVLCLLASVVLVTARAPAHAEERPRGAVATVEGRALTQADLTAFWFERYPQEYARTLGALLDERIAIAEAHREGVRVPRAALDKAVQEEVAARRKQLQRIYGEALDLESEVRRAYGFDVATWQRSVLAPRMHAQMLLNRVIRWDTRKRPRVQARVIVLSAAATAQAVHRKLSAGADFSLTALKNSVDPSGKRGGVLPGIGRGDLAFPGVEARLFAAKPGALVGPLEVRVEGKVQWQIYKVIRLVPAWTGGLGERWQQLEDDLAATPLDPGEFQRWQVRTRRDKGVTLFRPDGRPWTPPAVR